MTNKKKRRQTKKKNKNKKNKKKKKPEYDMNNRNNVSLTHGMITAYMSESDLLLGMLEKLNASQVEFSVVQWCATVAGRAVRPGEKVGDQRAVGTQKGKKGSAGTTR